MNMQLHKQTQYTADESGEHTDQAIQKKDTPKKTTDPWSPKHIQFRYQPGKKRSYPSSAVQRMGEGTGPSESTIQKEAATGIQGQGTRLPHFDRI